MELPLRSSARPYRHQPLDCPKRYIRLLRPVSRGDDLPHWTLEPFTLSEAPPYCALSYAWGEDSPTSTFNCDDASFPVTAHLLEGLTQSLRHSKPRRLWVDAICINQEDAKEKEGQIPLMAQIYDQASQVLVWLGTADNESDMVIDAIPDLHRKLQTLGRGNILTKDLYTAVNLPPPNDSLWRYLALFWSRPWFHRLWILQEIVLAREALFMCGNRSIDFDTLSGLCAHALRTGVATNISESSETPAEVAGYKTLNDVIKFRSEEHRPSRDSLALLNLGRYLRVTEPVDRVYGLFGLMEVSMQQSVTIDYSKEARQNYWKLYAEVGKVILKELGLDIILCFAESANRPVGLPSWVPNWNSVPLTCNAPGHYNAGYPSEHYIRNLGVSILSSDSIIVRGFSLGTIVATSPLGIKTSYDTALSLGPTGYEAENRAVISAAYHMYRRWCPGPQISQLERFARTLIADNAAKHGDGESRYTRDVCDDFLSYVEYLRDCSREKVDGVYRLTHDHVKKPIGPYTRFLASACTNRFMIFTENEHIVKIMNTSASAPRNANPVI